MSKGNYPVAIKSQASDDKITEIITQLFDKKQVVAGTDVRVDFSFSVDSLGMDIELADLPGGFTTNRNYWDDEEVRKDLLNADGAFFFISAYDVIHNPSEALKINRAFAIGKWLDEKTPPENFEPVNVVESVEDMFEAMIASRESYMKMFMKIAAAGAVLIITGTLGASYYIDGAYWKSVVNSVNRERERNNYSEAIKILDEFHSPFTSVILPGFIRSVGERASLRDEIYKEYEAELYAPIASEIDKINNNSLPEIDKVFEDTLKRVETYLDTSHFASINPEHYSRVRGSAWYFEAARLFNVDPTSSQMTPDEEFEIILRCLNYEAPENWRGRIQSRVDNLLRHWGRTSPSEGSPDSLEPYIDRAGQLINHPNISSEVADYLTERVKSWHEEQNARWRKIADDWIQEANSVKPEEGLKMLSSRMSEKIPASVRIILETAQANLYRTAADNALNYYADDIEELQNVLKKFPAMPNSDKERIAQKIAFLNEKRIEGRVRDINSSKTLGGLANVVKELGTDINVNSVRQAVSNTLSSLVNSRIRDIEAEAGAIIRQNNFSDGKQEISNMTPKLQSDIQGAVDSRTARPHIEKARSLEQELLTSLINANVEYCKNMFNSRKNTRSERDITMCLNAMSNFVSLWPEALRTREGSEINQVREFLSAIQGGVQGRLHIVSGYFPNDTGEGNYPDMMIQIEIGENTYTTKRIDDKVDPIFN